MVYCRPYRHDAAGRSHERLRPANQQARQEISKRKFKWQRTAPPPPPPPSPPSNPDIHYEAGWTDSWQHRRCFRKHPTLIEAAKCAMPTGAGWYVFAVEKGEPRELLDMEDEIVNSYRFGTKT